MDSIGILVGFVMILFLNSKINMIFSLLVGALTAGFLSNLSLQEIFLTVIRAVFEPMTLQLMVIVVGISGLGYLMEQTGSLNKMIDTLIAIFKNGKILSMLLPALIGTLSVPGGAILSAPMVEESGNRINLSQVQKTSVNLFFRHIGFMVYPLYTSMIMITNFFDIGKITIIKYNLLIMVSGIIVAYYVFFRGKKVDQPFILYNDKNLWYYILNFLIGFSSILIVLILAFLLSIPFHYAIFAGLIIELYRYLKYENIWVQLKKFILQGVDYKLASLIIGVMIFKAIVEASGAVDNVANYLLQLGIPLTIIVVILGLVAGYLTGINMAALGILIPLFLPLFNMNNPVPYISLLFTVTLLGYLISPIHLCLVLTKEYFETDFRYIYRPLYLPMLAMIITGIIQIIVLA